MSRKSQLLKGIMELLDDTPHIVKVYVSSEPRMSNPILYKEIELPPGSLIQDSCFPNKEQADHWIKAQKR